MKAAILLLVLAVAGVQTAYSPPVALEMAYMSAVAYESVLSIEAWNCKYCQQYKISLPKPFFNLTSGVRGFTGYSASLSRIIVSFKGADSITTFINDLKTARDPYPKCPNCEISRSFSGLYNTVQAAVQGQIESLHRIYRNANITVTGHGLGGVFAILAAADLSEIYQNVESVYTFGQPRVGNFQFAAFIAKTLPQTYRVINYGDIVPHLPIASAGFQHSSFEEWYQSGMQTYTTCEGETPSCSNSLPNSALNVNDNAIANYLNLKAVTLLTTADGI